MNNGLKPFFRNLKGAGYGRPLPVAFEFNRGYQGDAVNDTLTVPALENTGWVFPDEFSIEFWLKTSTYSALQFFRIVDITSTLVFDISITVAGNFTPRFAGVGSGTGAIVSVPANDNIPRYFVITGKKSSSGLRNYYDSVATTSFTVPSYSSNAIGSVQICPSNFIHKIAEVRFYNRIISQDEVNINFNSREGRNACKTEGIQFWYKFEKFEELGFPLSGGLPIGIRDHSGFDRHAKVTNAVVDPSNPNYVLKSW